MLWFFGIFIVLAVIFSIFAAVQENERVGKMNPAQKNRHFKIKHEAAQAVLHGNVNLPLVCPHCQAKGCVRTKPTDMKKGVSGAKATGALLTGGVSLLATGLSRKEKLTKAHCDNCKSDWIF